MKYGLAQVIAEEILVKGRLTTKLEWCINGHKTINKPT